jgi:peptidylprolyl isomerase
MTALPILAGLALAADAPPPLAIYFETQLPYTYEGDELTVAMTVKNITKGPVDNSKGLDLMAGLQVEDARGTKLNKSDKVSTLVTQPKTLEPNAFFGRILTMPELFPGLEKAGNYKVSWTGQGASGNSLVLHIVERYDPKKDYRAKIETDFGNIVIELNKEASPRHVRNFVDLTREGFYNGNQFHRVVPGQAIIGGSPTGDPAAGSGYNLDIEASDVPIQAGAVVQLRNKETGAMDSGSHIMILAIAKQDLRGKVSVLGKVVEGMDTVKTLCQVPTAKTPGAMPGTPEKPVKPLLIKKVTLTEVAPKAAPAKPPSKNQP